MAVQQDYRTEIKSHGRRQLELKSHFLMTGNRKDRYRLDTWIFIPASLGISLKNYSVERFFADINSLTRFSASHIPLADLLDPNCDISPLVRIEKELSAATRNMELRSKKVLYELRSLASIYSADSVALEKALTTLVSDGQLSIVKNTIKENLKEIGAFLSRWRSLYGLFRKPGIPAVLTDAYRWTDDSIGLTTERYLFNIYSSIDSDEESKPLLKRIRNLIEEEHGYRKKMGYSVLSENASEKKIERRIYRESILKKWAQSVLYLNHQESSSRRNMNHILAALAAAIAMSFAVVATLMAERYFPGRSFPWAVAIIVAYMFKDRIKESIRNILIHTLPSLVSDERIRLTDQASGKNIGRVNSRVRFLKARSAPVVVSNTLRTEEESLRAILPEEDLVHYRKEIVVRNRVLRRFHTRLENLSDIVRLNLESLFRNMDDPEKSVPSFAEGHPIEFPGHRIYPVDLVVCLSRKGNAEQHCFHYRITLDREGIKRIEQK